MEDEASGIFEQQPRTGLADRSLVAGDDAPHAMTPMRRRIQKAGHAVDEVAGRTYTRVLALFTGAVSAVMLVSAIVAWRISGVVPGMVWLSGALLFGLISRVSWRSRAKLSDVDFTA
jgi:hypothetical protein